MTATVDSTPVQETLNEAIHTAIAAVLDRVHTALPGQVETYDFQLQKASVKPLVKHLYLDGSEVALPVIVSVPVIFPAAGGASLTFPVKRGDPVLLLFTEASLENWLQRGTDSLPGDPRRFDLTDAVAVPGLRSFAQAGPAEDNDSIFLKYAGFKLRVEKSGKVSFSLGGEEIMDLIDQLFESLLVSVVPTAIGPQQLSEVTNGNIAVLKAKWDTLKGTP